MTEAELTREIRMWLRDPDCDVWDEEQMNRFIQKAVRKYSEDSGIFHGGMLLFPDGDGRCRYPDDYIYTLSACNERHELLELIDLDELRRFYGDYRRMTGRAHYIYEELNEPGYFRLCPNPRCSSVKETVYPRWIAGTVDPYGVRMDGGYGVNLNPERYGELYFYFKNYSCGVTEDGKYGEIERIRNREVWRTQAPADYYGTPYMLLRGEYQGELFYSRYGRLEEIHDKLTLMYAVCSMAYAADGDWQDVNQSLALEKEYRKRINAGRVKPMLKCRMRSF